MAAVLRSAVRQHNRIPRRSPAPIVAWLLRDYPFSPTSFRSVPYSVSTAVHRMFLLDKFQFGVQCHPWYSASNVACRMLLPEKIGVRCFSSSASPHVILEMPALSPTMNQGNIAKWMKKEGDKINAGDVICEIETDKATLEFESVEEGYLAKILKPEGSKDVLVGQPIAITVEDLEDMKNIPDAVSSIPEGKIERPAKREVSQTAISRISPSARLLIAIYGLDISSLKASGPRGTLLKSDVLTAVKSGSVSAKGSSISHGTSGATVKHSQPVHSSTALSSSSSEAMPEHDDLPNSQIRKVIAKRLVESKQTIPHFYLSSDVTLDPILALRNVLKEQHNIKLSINDIIIKAVALALRNVPEANAFWDDKREAASLHDTVDISIAVATEKGLMTPIVRDADQKTLSAISLEVKELAQKARTGKLAPNEFQGGTFSISNLGMFPVDKFCAIINPPQACILAVGQGNKVVEPLIDADGVEKIKVVTKMSLNLSADHRVYDTEIGGKFLSDICANLSDVQRLML